MNPELMTLIEAQAEALRADVDAIRAVLELVEPAAFMAAFSQLKPSRQAELTGLDVTIGEDESNEQN